MRLRRNRLEEFFHKKMTVKKDKEGSTSEEYGAASSVTGEIWPASGKVQAEQYGQRLNYIRNIRIQGRGGTDFRPVFAYVQEQRQKKELKDLKALIYFTDGDGIYPRSAPEYRCAFVFLEQTQKMDLVPPWAVKLLV